MERRENKAKPKYYLCILTSLIKQLTGLSTKCPMEEPADLCVTSLDYKSQASGLEASIEFARKLISEIWNCKNKELPWSVGISILFYTAHIQTHSPGSGICVQAFRIQHPWPVTVRMEIYLDFLSSLFCFFGVLGGSHPTELKALSMCRITPGRVWGTYEVLEIKLGSPVCKASILIHLLSL